MSNDTMPDLRYIVVCEESKEHNYITYQCSEPKKVSGLGLIPGPNEWQGGFTFKITNAILYSNYDSAKKVRDRMASIYLQFKMRVISKDPKEIFMKRLAG